MLVADCITKAYGSVRALRDVSINFLPGEIHAVLGENGAGKSTLVSVLAGFVTPDSGSVSLENQRLPLGRPFDCRKQGIAMIHQHFTLVPEFTVLENLALARVEKLAKRLDLNGLARPAIELARELSWQIEPTARTKTLSVGTQQRIEILKNLANDARVVIFDEPTAVLSPDEVIDLFRVLRRLRDAGKIVILIAHKLAEVMAVADRVTVLRRGEWVGTAPIAETSETALAEWMVGDLPESLSRPSALQERPQGLVVSKLSVKGDRGEDRVRSLDLKVQSGEIVGIGGVDGNGQVELAEALTQIRKPSEGDIAWQGRPVDSSVRIGYIPQDRQNDGLAVNMSVEENLLIEGRKRPELRSGPLFRRSAIRSWADGLRQRFDIRAASVSDPVRSLSGGNQQKVIVSRILEERPDLLVAVNPTRGLDLQASAFVYQQILNAAQEGTAVVLISTDLDELAALSDRSYFISGGRLVEAEQAVSLVGGTN